MGGSAATGARTIMAYSATGYETRVNYWSNPSVIFPITQTPTGAAGSENNAALLTLRRYTLAAVGDESSATCKSSVTTVAPVTTAPLNPVTTAPVNPVTTAPLNPVTTMPVIPPVTTLPVIPPVTAMPVNPSTAYVMQNKRV